jgi:hypothetical protein
MGLWLEARDDTGKVTFRSRFQGGIIDLYEQESITVEQAVKLSRLSGHLPLERRDWVLRISFDD